jgi:hypothetical protein
MRILIIEIVNFVDFIMRETKLIRLLKTLNGDEMKDFRKFVDSPFFNREGPYLLRFFDELRKDWPEFASDKLLKENLYKKLYPGKPYSDATMRKSVSALLKLAEGYLKYIAVDKDDKYVETHYLKLLRERKLDSLFELKAEEIDGELSDFQGKVDSEFFRHRFRLELEKINYFMNYHKMIKKEQDSLQKLQVYIVMDALINLLDIGYNVIVGSTTNYRGAVNLVKNLLDDINFDKFNKTLEENLPEFYPVFEIFYRRYINFVNFEDDKTYFDYKLFALANLDKLSRENRFTILISLQNTCIRKYIEGKIEFQHELFEILSEMLNRGLYAAEEDECMSVSSYRNFVITASNIGKLEWLEEFIDTYSAKLKPDQRESLETWARIMLLYSRKDYDAVLKMLQKINIDHFLTKHDIKSITLKIYFELDEYEPALLLAEAFRKMIANDKAVSGMHLERFMNFLNYYIKLIKMKAAGDFTELGFLESKAKTEVIHSKEWLMEKFKQLSN